MGLEDQFAELQRMIEGMGAVTAMVRAYYDGLLKEGFSEEESLALTAQFQHSIISTTLAGVMQQQDKR